MKICNLLYLRLQRFQRVLPIVPILGLFCLVMIIFLPYSCLRLKHSKCFYEGDKSYASFLSRNKAELRLASARYYFELAFNESRKPYKYGWNSKNIAKSSKPNLTILLMGTNRNRRHIDSYKPHYLSQSLYSLADSLDKDVLKYGKRWGDVNIMFCNIDKDPRNYTEAIFYSIFFRVVELPPAVHQAKCLHEQQLSTCFDQAMSAHPNSNYLLFSEDDMLARKDIWRAIYKFATERLSKKIAYIQLNTAMHEYHYSIGDASTFLEFILLAGGVTFAFFTVCFRMHLRPYNIAYNLCSCGSVFFTFSAVVWLIGRPHILSAYHSLTRHYLLGKPTHSGFSASLMSVDWAKSLSLYLRSITNCPDHHSKINAIDKFVRENGLHVLTAYPNLMQHVGLYSDYSKDTINPYHLDD